MADASTRPTDLRFAVSLPNLAEAAELVDLARAAEEAGWDGVLLWEHVHGAAGQPVPVSDPWVTLGAVAACTRRVRIGTSITPLPRRLPQEVARQVVTLDRLSGGRAILGVGLGEPPEEHTAYGRSADPRELAERLDEGLEVLDGLWTGAAFDHEGRHHVVRGAQYVPRARQEPRVPVWTSCVVQNDATLGRAARWDGVFLAAIGEGGSIDPVPVGRVRDARDELLRRRGSLDGYDIAVTLPALPGDAEAGAYRAAGATWVVITGWADQLHEVVGQLAGGGRGS